MARKPNKKMDKLRRRNLGYMAACAAAVIVIAVLLLIPRQETSKVPFTPPPFDTAAVHGEPEVPTELGWSQIRIRQGLSASVCGVLREEEGKVPVWFFNHPDSDSWLKLRITDTRGNILGESGLLRPGEHVQYVTLTTIPDSDTTVILRIMGYAPDTYYSAGSMGLETTLEVS